MQGFTHHSPPSVVHYQASSELKIYQSAVVLIIISKDVSSMWKFEEANKTSTTPNLSSSPSRKRKLVVLR
ncbi:hypothetical protein GBA52_007145 [Prunus armeniaca]|nr:hypothetical protein GBA52_007145 [Prunus armeniaca]